MELSALKTLDSSFNTFWERGKNSFVEGICDLKLARKNDLFFIRNKKFLKSWKEVSLGGAYSLCHLILGENIFKLLSEEEIEEIKSRVSSISTSKNIDYSICSFSKYFYEKLTKEENFEVDGRQMGNSDVHPTARIAQNVFIGEKVKIGKMAKIHAGVVIQSGSILGDDVEIFSNVTIYPRVEIGDRVRIHSGTVIGSDGYGYNHFDGIHVKVWHMGGVCIGDDVEIGANSCVDAGTFSPTKIGSGSKIDNKVQIAHNCEVGKGVIICGDVGLAGSASIGDFTIMGGRSAVADNCRVGSGCQLAGGAKVTANWPSGSILGGHPARPLKEWLRGVAFLRKESLKK